MARKTVLTILLKIVILHMKYARRQDSRNTDNVCCDFFRSAQINLSFGKNLFSIHIWFFPNGNRAMIASGSFANFERTIILCVGSQVFCLCLDNILIWNVIKIKCLPVWNLKWCHTVSAPLGYELGYNSSVNHDVFSMFQGGILLENYDLLFFAFFRA